jgi:hypothetical protein
VHLEAWVRWHRKSRSTILVIDGNVAYGAIDEQGKPRIIPKRP